MAPEVDGDVREVMDFLQWETAWDIDNPRG